MTLDQLKTFLWVSRLRGVRKAAIEMNLSQPAVSGRIAALEQSLGVTLFDRKSTGLELTKRGILLREHAERIADIIECIKGEVMPFESVDSLLRLGVAETIVQLWLPAFVSELYQTYPNIKIEITVDLSRNLEQQLIARSLDLAILMGPISDFSIDNTVLPPVDLTWFCAPGRQDSDLNSMPILSYSRNSRPYLELRREMTNRYGNDFKIFSSISVTAGLELVASGMGVGIFPRQLGMNLVAEGRIIEFDPGWVLDPLIFTASHLGDPRSELCAQAAALAVKVARKSNRK